MVTEWEMSAPEKTPSQAESTPAKSESNDSKNTALRWLLELPKDTAIPESVYMDAMFKGAGPFNSGQIRRYLQLSGKKVAKTADGILALGVNVSALKDLADALNGTGERIGLGDALVIVKNKFGVEIPPEVVRILELASR